MIWQIHPVHEAQGGAEVMPVWLDADGRSVGSFELCVCDGCGLCEWWAHGIRAPAPGAPANGEFSIGTRPPCDECGSPRVWVVGMHDLVPGHPPVPMLVHPELGSGGGRLLADLCADCGLTRWSAPDLRGLPEPAPSAAPLSCSICRTHAVYRTIAVDARSTTGDRGDPRLLYVVRAVASRIGLLTTTWMGRLALLGCHGCGHVDWVAERRGDLREDDASGIRLLRHAAPPRGPYR